MGEMSDRAKQELKKAGLISSTERIPIRRRTERSVVVNVLTDSSNLIEKTIEEINEEWEPGILPWMEKERPNDYRRMETFEQRININSMSGNIGDLIHSLDGLKSLMVRTRDEYKEHKR